MKEQKGSALCVPYPLELHMHKSIELFALLAI